MKEEAGIQIKMDQRKLAKLSSNWLEQIYEERKQELFRFLYVILGDVQAAEDALQETFLKAYCDRETNTA